LRQEFFEKSCEFLSEAMASLVRPNKTEVKWHSFAGSGRGRDDDRSESRSAGRGMRGFHQRIKRNLVIFVTARVITPAGLAFNNEEEEEEEEQEGLLPPALPECRRIRNRANHELTLIDTN
jgi:hypothetical protein